MPFPSRGYAALSSTSPLSLFHFVRRDPRADDVVIEILYCGICHSDLHNVRNDWGYSKYPMVPGHEIVGRVIQIGASVTKFKVDDAVGVGCLVDSCRTCQPCQKGDEQFCVQQPTYGYGSLDRHDGQATQGGFSDVIVVSQDFVLRIPDGLELSRAAPLLCAGITVWSPLQRHGIGPGKRVAVVGLGGLGHMAIKLAKSLGAEVTLITRSDHKAASAQALGADQVVVNTEKKQLTSLRNQFDLVLDTVPYAHDVNPYMGTLAPGGKLVMLGYFGPLEPALNTSALLFGQRALEGSLIGGIAATQSVLDFCGQHQIAADVEVISPEEINTAFERLLRNEVPHRFVVDLRSVK